MNIRSICVALAATSTLASGAAHAQQQGEWRLPHDTEFWGYVGAGAGESSFKGDCSGIFDCDRRDTAWKVQAGGNFNSLLGLELGYVDFGRMRAFGGDTDAHAASVALTLGTPVGERFGVFAKGGAAYGRTDVTAALGTVESGKRSDWGTTWGVGATWAFTRSLQLRVDWDRYNLDFVGGDRDVDLVSAGLQMRF